jgi:hypothetical protein
VADHPQTPLTVLPGVSVDEGIRRLIEFLNRSGWRTVYSCQGSPDRRSGDPGCPYVMFAAAASLAGATVALSDLALNAGDHHLAARVLGEVTAPVGPDGSRWVQTQGDHWRYEVGWNFHPLWDPASARELTATIRFSTADLAAVSALL